MPIAPLLAVSLAVAVQADGGAETGRDDAAWAVLADRAAASVVTVRVVRDAPRPARFGPLAGSGRGGDVLVEQSAVVVAGPGGRPLVLTTFRAAAFAPSLATALENRSAGIAGGPRAEIGAPGAAPRPAAVWAADPRSGLAAFAVLPAPPGRAAAAVPPPLPVAPEAPRRGATVLTLHAVADAPPAAVRRQVAGVGRAFPGEAGTEGPAWLGDDPGPGELHGFGTLLELAPPPPPGSGGGVLLDGAGAIAGLLVEPPADAALPPRVVPLSGGLRRIAEALLAGEPVGYGLLGVEPADAAAADSETAGPEAPTAAARVVAVRGGSPAEAAGVRPGEWIEAVARESGDRRPVRSAADLVREVALAAPGSVLTLHVYAPADGSRRAVDARLVKAATGRAAGGWPAVAQAPAGAEARGVRVEWPTAVAPPGPGEPFPPGVRVIAAAPGSPVAVGDAVLAVNGSPVAAPADFAAALAVPDPVSLRLGDGRAVVLPPP